MIDTVFGKFESKRHVWQYLLSVSATYGTTSCGSHGFREDFKRCPIFSQKKRMTPGGHGYFKHQKHRWQDLCRGIQDINL